MSAQPRVFISHVNGDSAGDAVWRKLSVGLGKQGFDVLVDREMLKPGDEWRREMFSWISLCHAAVILISRKALEEPNKYWVARETTCLIYRRSLEPSLRIIPVLLEDVTFSDLEQSERFRGLQLKEIEAIRSKNPKTILTQLCRGIGQLDPQTEPGHARLAGQISAELDGINSARIKAAIERCGIDLGRWSEAEDPPRRLALCLLATEVVKLPDILGYLVSGEQEDSQGLKDTQSAAYLQSARNIQRIRKVAELLLSNWVEMEAAQGIVEEAVKKADDQTRRALLLNTEDERMAVLYVLRAFPDIKPAWTLFSLTGVFGEWSDAVDVKNLLLDEIEREIEQKIWVERELRERDPERRRKIERENRLDVCIDRVNRRRPIFVTAEIPSGAPALADVIRSAAEQYRFATFLLRGPLDVAEAMPAAAADLFRLLQPALSAERCRDFRIRHNDLYGQLHGAREDGPHG